MAKSKIEEAWEPYVGSQGFQWVWKDELLLQDRVGHACKVKAYKGETAWIEFRDGEEIIAARSSVGLQ